MITRPDYEFLMGRNKSNDSFSRCLSYGYCVGVDMEGRPIITNRGVKALNHYRDSVSDRIDVV